MEINRIYGEDCQETMGKMPNDFIDLTITSPPYFNARDYSQYDNVKAYMSEMACIFQEIFRVSKPSRMVIVNISPVLVGRSKRSEQSYRIPLPFYFVPMMEDLGFEFLEDIIWEKPEGSTSNRNGGFFKNRKPIAYKPNIVTEYVFVFKKPAPFLIDKVLRNESLVLGDYERTNIWRINPETKSWHPAPFPEKLAELAIKYYSYENDIIYDPFGGSGTVAKVSKKLNRNYILSEKNVAYANRSASDVFSFNCG